MLENLLIAAKIIASAIFIVLSILMIIMAFYAREIKEALIEIESEVKTQLNTTYNVGAAAAQMIVGSMIAKSNGLPFWFKFIKLTSLAKYDHLLSPIKAIIEAFLEIKEKLQRNK